MSPSPQGKNDLINPAMFEERLNYKQNSFSIYEPIPLDMIYEKPFYGKVDNKGRTIYPTEINMEQLPGPGLIMTHDFVAKAFFHLKDMVEYNVRSKSRRFVDLFPNGFSPKSATKNFHKLYQDHFVDTVYDPFINNYLADLDRKRKVATFADFVKSYVDYSREVKNIFPVTKTGFIMSHDCPHAISGLIIEMEGISKDDDSLKYEGYISKPSFTEYVKLVSSFGFYVDKNCPWRIAVNLDHPRMTEKYMPSFGTSYEDGRVFDDYFLRSEYFSYEDFKSRMWYAYQDLLADVETTSFGIVNKVKNCFSPAWADLESRNYKTYSQEGFLQSISEDYDGAFQEQYPDSFFLPHYFKIRLAEGGKNLSSRQYNAKLNKILKVNKMRGIEAALDLMDHTTNQSKIYLENKKSKYPRKIKYFGKNITSGLHSYKGYDKVSSGASPQDGGSMSEY